MATECSICFSEFFDLHHRPVASTCSCTNVRVCESCAPQAKGCPQCRTPLSVTIDFAFFADVCRTTKSVRCPGCNDRVATRVAAKHQASCAAYLAQAYRLEMSETGSLRTMYRAQEREKETMRARLIENARLIRYLRDVSGGGGLSWPTDEESSSSSSDDSDSDSETGSSEPPPQPPQPPQQPPAPLLFPVQGLGQGQGQGQGQAQRRFRIVRRFDS